MQRAKTILACHSGLSVYFCFSSFFSAVVQFTRDQTRLVIPAREPGQCTCPFFGEFAASETSFCSLVLGERDDQDFW